LLFVITTMETFPYVKKVEFTFLEQPNIKWTLKPLSAGIDIMKVHEIKKNIYIYIYIYIHNYKII